MGRLGIRLNDLHSAKNSFCEPLRLHYSAGLVHLLTFGAIRRWGPMGWLSRIFNSICGNEQAVSNPQRLVRSRGESTPPPRETKPIATSRVQPAIPPATRNSKPSHRLTTPSVNPPSQASIDARTSKAKSASSPAYELRGLEWMGPGQKLRLTGPGYQLIDPLVYFFDGRSGLPNEEPAAININLPVSPEEYSSTGRELTYWPRYDGLTPGQRRYFLQWLAEGRRQIPSELGYTFLFIYHLERRALVDEADHLIVFNEVLRLRALYAESAQLVSRSFDSYTSSFLWFLIVRDPALFNIAAVHTLCDTITSWTQDNLASALCWFSETQTPLPEWFASHVAGELPKSQRSVVLKRVGDEFAKLFGARFRERFPTGIEVRTPNQTRQYSYRPASAALTSLTVVRADPLASHARFNSLSELWNECLADLRRLSGVVGKEGQAKLTVTTWEAMPPEIRQGFEHPLTDAFCKIVNECSDESGSTIVPASQLAALIGIEGVAKLTLAQSRRLSETASHIGYCLEPDPVLTGRPYRMDEPVAVFLHASEALPDRARYSAAACMLTVGMAVAAADGKVQADEVSILTQQVEAAFELNEAELRRLEVLRSLIVARGADLTMVSRLAKRLTREQREAVGKLILVLVAADGVVTREELKAVRKLYASLGFERDEITRAIDSLAASDEPITVVAPNSTGVGEAIPAPAGQSAEKGLRLNHDAIAAIMRDTQEVARMLATAMDIHVDPTPTETPPQLPADAELATAIPTGATVTLSSATELDQRGTPDLSVPQRYAAFYHLLIAKSEWQFSEAESLAQKHGHMLSGALETLNDWAFEKFGGQLFVEDGDRVIVETSYLG